MSDQTFAVLNGINKKLKDMGDGTFAEIVYNANASGGGGSGGAVTLADGANVAQGATTDAAFSGTGATTLVGALKGIYARLGSLVLAAGTNKIGGVTLADGDSGTHGAKADTAYAGGGGSASIIALLKGLYNALIAPTPAGSNVIGIVDTADLDVTGSVTSAAVLFTQDVSNFGSVGVQATSAGSACTVAYEVSNDGTNWVSAVGLSVAAATAASGVLTTSAAQLLLFSTAGIKWFRARVSTYGSGTVAASARFKKQSIPPQWVPNAALAAGNNPIGALSTSLNTVGSLSLVYRLVAAAASTNAVNVKNTPGRIYKIDGYNAAAAIRYLKIYAKASAPTVGTDTPLATIALAPSSRFEVNWADLGLYCALGIGLALTTGSADSDTGAVSANDVLGLNIAYV